MLTPGIRNRTNEATNTPTAGIGVSVLIPHDPTACWHLSDMRARHDTGRSPLSGTSLAVMDFSFEGAPVRAVTIEGEPHLVAKDVAERLGYVNATDAANRHCRGVAKHYPIVDALGRSQNTRVITEPDVLRLIMGSKLPAAERFERWVFEEVLPSIRKTGGYMVAAPDETPEEVLARAVLLAHDTLARVKAQLAVAQPKAEGFDRIAGSEGAVTMTEAAKVLRTRHARRTT